MKPEYPFLEGSLDTLIITASHKVEIDVVDLTNRAEALAEQEGCSPDMIAYTALYNAGLISYDEE